MSKDNSLLNFLGAEFLTWLYFHLDSKNGEMRFSDYSTRKVSFDNKFRMCVGNRAVMKPLVGKTTSVSVISTALDDSGEVLQALRAGGLIDLLSLEIHFEQQSFLFSVNAKDGSISQFRNVQPFKEKPVSNFDFVQEKGENQKPDVEKEIEDEAILLLRMSSLDEAEEILDALYAKFLERRLLATFTTQDLADMRKSVQEGLLSKIGNERPESKQDESRGNTLEIWA